jgi:hypothetical protein
MSAQEARRLGAIRYWGAPCVWGHSGERYTKTGNCLECQRGRSYDFKIRQYKENEQVRQKIIAKVGQWQLNNKDKRKASHDARKINNPSYRLIVLIRGRLYQALKNIRANRRRGTSRLYLGCDLRFLRHYIQLQFRDGMTWENCGVAWELDHRLPLASFDLTDEWQLREACHYSNLQPLLKEEHRRKKPDDLKFIRECKLARTAR